MYYEEIQDSTGGWWFRTAPDGQFSKFTYKQLQRKCNDFAGRITNARACLEQDLSENGSAKP